MGKVKVPTMLLVLEEKYTVSHNSVLWQIQVFVDDLQNIKKVPIYPSCVRVFMKNRCRILTNTYPKYLYNHMFFLLHGTHFVVQELNYFSQKVLEVWLLAKKIQLNDIFYNKIGNQVVFYFGNSGILQISLLTSIYDWDI